MSSKRLEQLFLLLENSPADSFLLFAVAKEYEKLDDREKALSYYRRLAEQDPGYVGLYYHLGKLLERCGEWNEALKTYELGMEAARRTGDRHAFGELAAAKMNLEGSDG